MSYRDHSTDMLFLSVLQASPDCIRLLDVDGSVQFMNDQGLRLFEIEDFERNRGRYWPELWSLEGREAATAALEAARAGRVSTFRAPCATAKGTPKWWDTSVAPVFDDAGGAVVRILVTSRDITDQLAASEAVAEALARAERANRAKDDFLANMSHEVRTPLNGIMGLSEMLVRSPLAPAQREMVGLVQESAAVLTRTLADILDLVSMEACDFELEEVAFDLDELVRDVAAEAEVEAEQKGLHLRAETDMPPSHLTGDPHRLRQVLAALLSNAVKFTREGEVVLWVERVAGDLESVVRFEVRDTGIGFSEQDKARLFDPFEQGDGSITRAFGGAGLGLSITRALVERMGGRLQAEARPGDGATFTVELPLPLAVDAAAAPPPSVADVDAPRLRVLLAEDHPINRRIVELILDSAGADLTSVENGELAVEEVRARDFDLILMDMQMPVMDGLTATRLIRQRERQLGRPRTPVICVTANAMPQHVEASRLAEMDLHLAKPITAPKLLGAIESVLSGGRRHPFASDRPALSA